MDAVRTRPALSPPQAAESGPPLPLAEALARAKEADGDERCELAGKINRALEALPRSMPAREAADLILTRLGDRSLEDLADANGMTCRAAAVGVLLELGFPYALEIEPDDLEHYRQVTTPRRPWWRAVAAGLVWPLGALELAMAVSDHELGRLGDGGDASVAAVASHVGMTLASAASAALSRDGGRGRTWARWALAGSAVVGVALAVGGVVPALGTALAALLAGVVLRSD